MGGKKLSTFIDVAIAMKNFLIPFFGIKKLAFFRRLSYFADKEDKSRVIAIGDYFTQTVLRPLHLYLFRFLKKVPQDVTFNQARFLELIKDWEYFYSVDLSSATDRFPISFISSVLRGVLPS